MVLKDADCTQSPFNYSPVNDSDLTGYDSLDTSISDVRAADLACRGDFASGSDCAQGIAHALSTS